MAEEMLPEPWLRGTLAEVDAVRRQVLHALELAGEDVARWCGGLSDDEMHARQMLDLLPKGFILENLKEQAGDWRVDFRPDPKYSPSGIEERVLHGMSGWMLINQKQMRLHHIEGRLPADVNIGFGLVSVKSGSNFESTKAPYDEQWRTIRVISDIRGKAALFKAISRNQDVARGEFKRVDNNLTVAQAVEMLKDRD